MTTWTVEGTPRGYNVVKWEDNHRVPVRARFENLSCIDARVLAAELNGAYELGREDARWDIFAGSLGDG